MPEPKSKKQEKLPRYSTLFQTVYDEQEPVVGIGRGCHYSILRAKDNTRKDVNAYFDFAVLWDEDHDKRVIPVLEALYQKKLLVNYVVVGERKGGLTAVLKPNRQKTSYTSVPELLFAEGDPWSGATKTIKEVGDGRLTNGTLQKEVEDYINGIIAKWHLGTVVIGESLQNTSTTVSSTSEKKETKSDLKKDDNDSDVDKLTEQLEQQAKIDVYHGKIVKATTKRAGRQVSLYGLPNRTKAEAREKKWQRSVSEKFFRVGKPLKPGCKSHKIYTDLTTYLEGNKVKPFPINGLNRRSFIIALSKVLTDHGHMPEITFQLGKTKIRLTRENSYTQKQKGNFSMEIPALGQYQVAYGRNCVKRLKWIYEPSWEKDKIKNARRFDELKKSIAKRLQTMQSFHEEDFNNYGFVYLTGDRSGFYNTNGKVQSNIDFLNGLIFLVTTVEVLERLYRTKQGELYDYYYEEGKTSDAFPVAMAQARSIMLLLTGKISLTDFVGESLCQGYNGKQHNAYYGAVTGKSNIQYIDMVFEKLGAINRLHNTTVLRKREWRSFCDEYKGKDKYRTLIEGRSSMYFNLKAVYGAALESDEETSGYSDSDDSDSEASVMYKP